MASQAIGIDIGSHSLKVAVVQKKGGVSRAVRLYQAPLAGDSDLVRVQGALNRAGVSGGPALLGLTGRDLIVRYTHVPPVPDWRLDLLMKFEINEVSGQSGEEVAADYHRLELPVDSGEETVLVALARNSFLGPRLNAVQSSGLKVGGGCPCSIALFNAFLTHSTFNEGETTYLVNIGRENIDMAIQRDGQLLFARNMAGGGGMFTEAIMSTFGLREPKAEKNKLAKGDLTPRGQARYPDATSEKLANAMQAPAGQLVSMIQSTVMICRAQTKIADLNVDRLVLTGGGAAMRGIQKYFQANMNVPVEVFDASAEIDVSSLAAQDAAELGDSAPEFSVAIGLAETLLQPNAFRLEVLTEKERKKRTFSQRTIWAVAAAVAALALVVMLFKTRADNIAKVQAANAKLGAVAGSVENDLKKQNTAMAAEGAARRKAVALRARRLPGLLQRAVLKLLQDNETDEVYVSVIESEAKKISLGLAGHPAADRSTGDEDERANNLHDQEVWPECVVRATVQQRFTDSPGRSHNEFTTRLGTVVKSLRVDGYEVEFDPEGLDSNRNFRMTFRLKAVTGESEES